MPDKKRQRPKVKVIITTPRGVKFEEEGEMVVMRTTYGDVGIMHGHEDLMAGLGDGTLRIVNEDSEKKLAVFGGVATVTKDRVNIYTTIAQSAEEIDRERLIRDKEIAERKIEEAEDIVAEGYQIALKHALLRMEVIDHYDLIDLDRKEYD